MCSPLSTSVALNWISCPVCSDVCWVLLFHWRHEHFIGLRHTLKQVAQLWWKCKSLSWRVKQSRARSTDVWRENGKNRSGCKTSAQWLVSLSEFDSFGSITFGKTRRARLDNFIFIKVSGEQNQKVAALPAELKNYLLLNSLNKIEWSEFPASYSPYRRDCEIDLLLSRSPQSRSAISQNIRPFPFYFVL